MDTLSATFAALADPTRRAILARLSKESVSLKRLAEPFALSLPTISRHVKVLEEAGLVTKLQFAQFRLCRLGVGPLTAAGNWIGQRHELVADQRNSLGA